MALYRLAERMFLKTDDAIEAWLHEAGETVSFSGIPHRHMLPLDEAARAALAAVPPLTAFAENIAKRRGQPRPAAMTALYRLNSRTFIKADGTQEAWLHSPGEVIFYSGQPGPSMDALNDQAIAAKAAEAAAAPVSRASFTRAGKWDAWAG